MERGFLYAATGERWVREAAASASRLERIHPDLPVVLFTDLPELASAGPFDEVITLPERRWAWTEAKVWSVGRSPFERTVYLDTDTHVVGDVSDLFRVLDRFDFAAVPIQRRVVEVADHAHPPDIPDAFQSVNGGVLAYRRNERTRELFDRWWELYQADIAGTSRLADQPSLRVALWRSQVDLLHLPPELNMRTIRYKVQPVTAVGPVRVIHGRPKDLEALERRWNADTSWRLLTPIVQYQARLLLRFLVRGRPREALRRRLRPWLTRVARGE